jgi:hypothetical protein
MALVMSAPGIPETIALHKEMAAMEVNAIHSQ